MSALPNPQALAQQFADEVWTGQFNNVSSPALIQAWSQLFSTYNECIQNNLSGVTPVRKQVIPMPTGTGKSQATIFYLQQLEAVEDVGALVVSFFEDEAQSACRAIKKNAFDIADYHSANHPLSDEAVNNTQVLYIAHAQYLLALQEPGRMKRLGTYRDQPRQLIIIDEQLSQVNDYEFTLLNTTTLLSKIQTLLESDLNISDNERQGLEDEKAFLTSVRDLINQSDVTSRSGVMLSADQQPLLRSDTGKLAHLSKFVKGGKTSKLAQVDEGIDFEVMRGLTNTLKAIQSQKISYIRSSGSKVYINSLEWLNIDEHHAVMLDATATTDFIYTLHDDVSIQNIPAGLRRYDNVALHTSEQMYKLGKNQLEKVNAEELFNSLASLIEHISPQPVDPILDCNLFENEITEEAPREQVLIILPKKVRDKVENHYDSFWHEYSELWHIDIHFAHWGNITGKNDYRHCSKVIIASLPYKGKNHVTNLHITSKRGLTAIKKYNDDILSDDIMEERTKIEYGTMAAEVIQAINRVRCRSVIDDQGHCEPTDVYLFQDLR